VPPALPIQRGHSAVSSGVRSAGVVDNRSDEALLAAMAMGDEAGGIAFVRRYQRRVFGLARGIVADPGVAEEIAQEALIRVWRHAPAYDARRGSVATWVLTITRNLAIDALRLRRAVPMEPDDLIALGLASNEGDPAEAAQRSDATTRVHEVLRQLPSEQRRALLLSAYYGLTAQEISARDQIPLGTVKTRIRSALAKVRAALADPGEPASPVPSTTRAGEGVDG
jgi:RNA polymerase sigma factor (sigma-70 family)